MIKDRFLVPAHGPDATAVAVGVEALSLLCEKHSTSGLVLMPALKHASGTVLGKVWPEKNVEALSKGKTLKLSSGHSVSMCSPLTLKNHSSAQVILALFASKDMIEKAEGAWACKALVVVPWIPEDVEFWVKQNSPTVLSIPANG